MAIEELSPGSEEIERLRIEDAQRLGAFASLNVRRTQSGAPEKDRIIAGQKAKVASHLKTVVIGNLLPIGDGALGGKGFDLKVPVDSSEKEVIEEARSLFH